jgi:hypothetical protein
MDTAIQAARAMALMCLSPCSTIPSGETPLSNDYGIVYAGKALKETQPGHNLNY